jgi:hypothetical protein
MRSLSLNELNENAAVNHDLVAGRQPRCDFYLFPGGVTQAYGLSR